MTNIPYFFEAKQVTTMALVPQTPGAAGLLTAVTVDAADLISTGTFDHFTFQGSRNLFEYSPANASIENYQPGKRSFRASIGQIDLPGKETMLLDTFANYLYVVVTAVGTNPFTNTAGATFTLVAAIGESGTGWIENRNATTLDLMPCGILPTWS